MQVIPRFELNPKKVIVFLHLFALATHLFQLFDKH
jgi:hypothetical protein